MAELGEIVRAGFVPRRQLLRAAALGSAGLAAAALLGCGDEGDDAASSASAPVTGAAQAAAGVGQLIKDPNLPYPYQFPDPPGTPKSGGTLRFISGYDISVFDPTKSSAGGTLQVTNPVYNRLLGFVTGAKMDPFKLELEPELAKSWERSPDGMTFKFTLTPGVRWQNIAPLNGRAFVAEDVRVAYEAYRTGAQASYFTNVDTIKAVDEATLTVTMKRPVADFVVPLAGRYLPIVPRELLDDGSIAKKAIGTGPMILDSAEASAVLFKRNPDYWATKVLLDGFEIRITPDAAARLAAYRAGQVDYAYRITETLTDVKNVLKTNPDVQVQLTPLVSNTFALALNLSLPKYSDERVRQAISLAIDRPTMINILAEGLGKSLPTTPWDLLFDKEPSGAELGRWWRYAPDESKQLLRAAGVDGLKINSTYYAYGPYNTRASEILTDQLRAVGIELSDRSVDYTQFNSQWTTGKLAEATTSGWQAAGYDHDNYFYNQVHSTAPGNRIKLNDAQMDKWAEQQQVQLNPTERRAIHRKMWDYELEKVFRITSPLGFNFQTYHPWVRGIRSGGRGTSVSYDEGAMIESAWLDK